MLEAEMMRSVVLINTLNPYRGGPTFSTYRWHSNLSFKSSSNTVINSFRLPPARVNTFVHIALVSVEAFSAFDARLGQFSSHSIRITLFKKEGETSRH